MTDPEDSQPRIELDPRQVICNRHGEPFREKWPSGYPLFLVRGFQTLMAQDEFQAELGGDVAKFSEATRKRPICCRLGSEVLLTLLGEINNDLHIWPTARRCQVCGQRSIGSRFQTKTQSFSHMCFECMFTRMVIPESN